MNLMQYRAYSSRQIGRGGGGAEGLERAIGGGGGGGIWVGDQWISRLGPFRVSF